jgi:hypothetical protein
VLCFLESGDSSFTRHSGKTLKKVFECFSAFEIVKESLDGDSGSAEHGRAAKNIGVFNDNPHKGILSRRAKHLSAKAATRSWQKRTRNPQSSGGPQTHFISSYMAGVTENA